jgi:ATP-dependent protease Clp ATPase subunit
MKCSFCQIQSAKDEIVAGAEVYICRNCVGLCIEVFANKSASWRDQQIALLARLRDESSN